MTIRRAFIDLPHGQLHYRHAGEEGGASLPLVLLHASPGSSRQLLSFINDMAQTRRVIAPDTPGNGDSVALPLETLEITDLAQAMVAMLDALGIERADFYGSHTGACIAAEIAILAPDRVGRIILDGIAVLDEEGRADFLTHYALPFEPDMNGAYLMDAFQFLRDQFLFFPWYKRERAYRRDDGIGGVEEFHAWLVELLKANTSYQRNYHAAFRWEAYARAALIPCPTLVTAADNDPLVEETRSVTGHVPDGRFGDLPRGDDADFSAIRAQLFTTFLDG